MLLLTRLAKARSTVLLMVFFGMERFVEGCLEQFQ